MTERPGPEDLPEVSRRRAIAGAGGLLSGVGAIRAIDNVLLGYGELGNGTNLLEQDLAAVASENISVGYDDRVDGHRLRLTDGALLVSAGDGERRLAFETDERERARELDADLGLDGRLAALYADTRAVRTGQYRMTFSQPAEFFQRVREAEARPDVVAGLRGRGDRRVDPDVVERFAGVSPRRPESLADELVAAFREHASYDVPRYAAGSIEDNVVFRAVDLRTHFENDVSFEAMLEAEETGLFCWELVVRSMEALQAVAPWAQSVPVANAYVRDKRHKHAYTGVASAVREDGELVLPMTFLDYTHSTLYDDLHITPVTGRGLAAYDDRHRATHVFW